MANKKILVVDDEPDILKTIKLSLKMEGYEVITALDGEEALRKAHNKKPDIIILDVMLPTINGYEVARSLKFDERYKHMSIIILTAHTQKMDQELWRNSGADLYMTKPFELDKLKENIKGLLSNSSVC